jgi:hypothetical protein
VRIYQLRGDARLRTASFEDIWQNDAATLAVTAWLVLIPFLRPWRQVEKLCSDDRCVIPWFVSQTKYLVPKFAERWIDAWASNPGAFALGKFGSPKSSIQGGA